MKKVGGMIENYLRQHPDKINWNNKGEFIYRGEAIKGSNISNLIRNVLTRTGRNDKSGVFPTTTFTKALAELNVPEDWVKNKKQLGLFHSYKTKDSDSQYYSTPHNRKRTSATKSNWLSSTSSFR